MRLHRVRVAILFIGVAATAAIGVEAMSRRRYQDGDRAGLLTRVWTAIIEGPTDAVPGCLVPPISDEPIEVSLPPVSGEKFWGLFPALGDLDGDGRGDLLVGNGMGRMQFHRNIGTTGRPQFAWPEWFDDLCPNGRIPTG